MLGKGIATKKGSHTKDAVTHIRKSMLLLVPKKKEEYIKTCPNPVAKI